MNYTIYQKTPKEMEEEKQEYDLGAALLKQSKGWDVCPTYIIDRNGDKRDTWSLTIVELYDFCMVRGDFNILKYTNKGYYSQYSSQEIRDYTTLSEILKKVNGITDPKLHELGRDFIGSVGGNALLDKARTIATYKTDIEGVKCTPEQIVEAYARFEQKQKLRTK